MQEDIKQDKHKIKEYLESEIDAVGIILCGSRHVGDYKEKSDWDLKVLVEKDPIFKTEFPGYSLDATFHHPKTTFTFEEFGLKLRFCEILSDTPEKDAKRIIDEAHEFYDKGPEPWTKEYAVNRQYKVQGYERKFADCIADKKWFELHQRLNWHFLETTYTYWYGLRREWEPRPQNIMDDLMERDPEYATILKELVDPNTSDLTRVELFNKLHRVFFESKVYREYIE